MADPRTSVPGRWLLLTLVVCAAVLVGGCGKKSDAPAAGDSAPPADATSAGPLAGVSVPLPPTPDAAQESQTAPGESAAGPRFPAPSPDAQLVRLVIPKAKVDHHFVVKGLTPGREMEDPGGKDDVAWYTFSARPGFGSNAVLSGHVDWYTGEAGVFWYLRNLKEGDEAEVYYSDGMVLKYRVVRSEVYGADDAPVAEITGPTTTDTLTMITCDGVFSRSTHEYNQRRVVWAERIA
jgi:LPXTG-site transpeptidase (sortase) family protein